METRFLWVLLLHASFVLLAHVPEVFAGNASVRCIERERQALLALKKGFGISRDFGGNTVSRHFRLSSWGSAENQNECCKWKGVQCNYQTGHVIKLDLRGDLHYYFEGTISPSLSQLRHLNYLDLSNNNFKNLTHLPKFIASLTQLKYLNLSYADIPGKIPFEWGDLFHLQYLDLQHNSLRDILTQLRNLSHLQYLDLQYNSMEKIPTQLYNLPHLQHLNLAGNYLSGLIPTQLGNLSSLKFLGLSQNFFNGTIPPNLGSLCSLQHLEIDLGEKDDVYSSYDTHIDSYQYDQDVGNHLFIHGNSKSLRSDLEWVSHLTSLYSLKLVAIDLSKAKDWVQRVGNLSHLRQLYFSDCNLMDSEPWSFESINSNLNSLVEVDLSHNKLTFLRYPWLVSSWSSLAVLRLNNNNLIGPIPEAFGNFKSLEILRLQNNRLEGEIPKSLLDICTLRLVDLSNNSLSGLLNELIPTFSRCANHSLQKLHLSRNRIAGSVPDLSKFSSLQLLYLNSNGLNGTLSNSIGQLSDLVVLRLDQNFLQDVVSEAHFLKLSKLQELDLSFNSLVFDVSPDWIPPFQLQYIYLSFCKLGPYFPQWLQTQNKFTALDISGAEISDIVPSWFWNLSSSLSYLNLSHNHIRVGILVLPLNSFTYMDLSSNMFEGPIPSNLTMMTINLDLSNNKFTDASSFLCPRMPTPLLFLDISNNHLSGELPNCWRQFESLIVLNLENNYLNGKIPTTIGSLIRIQALHLGNNKFVGEIPINLNESGGLAILDVSKNNLSGLIPSWIGDKLNGLNVLSLRSNMFYGSVPSNICHLSQIQILDLSLNNISGVIPKCLNDLTAMGSQGSSYPAIKYYYGGRYIPILDGDTSFDPTYTDSASLTWKGILSQYKNTLGLVRSIDLSGNRLVGEIPKEIMNLTGLISLNLSRNMLSGEIPRAIGQLKSLDSLDLSRNHLSGKIPSQCSELGLLGVLDLSYNNLSGEIPISTKLQSFDASTYMGNPELCGAPLPACSKKLIDVDVDASDDKDGEELYFYISMPVGFVSGFWGVCGSLIFKKSWRYAYFRFFSNMYDKLYVLVAINMAKLKMRLRAST